jgi:2-aminoadipate transaminase
MALISFARGVPTPLALPVEELADCARAAVERDGQTDPQLRPGRRLRAAPRVGRRAPRRRDEPGADHERLAQGLSLLAGLALDPGSRLLVEGPTYDRALHIAARHEAEPVPLPMDDDGLDPGRDRAARRFLYTIPTFQNPSGRTLSLERRRALAELARDGKLLIVEDDPYSLVRYEGERLPRSTSSPRARASSTRSRSRRSPRRGCGSAT